MSFKMEDRGGLLGGVIKNFGMGNQKAVWELDETFDILNSLLFSSKHHALIQIAIS